MLDISSSRPTLVSLSSIQTLTVSLCPRIPVPEFSKKSLVLMMVQWAAFALTNLSFFHDFGTTWPVQGMRSPVASQRIAKRAQVSFVISKLPLRPKPNDCPNKLSNF